MSNAASESGVMAHRHDCSRCRYAWLCWKSGGRHPGDDVCAICEALDRMQGERTLSAKSRPAAMPTGRQVEGDSGEISDAPYRYYGESA